MILTRLVAVGVLTYSFNGAYAMTECPTVENATATATRAKAPGDEPSFGFSVDTGAGVQIVGAAGEMGSGERGKADIYLLNGTARTHLYTVQAPAEANETFGWSSSISARVVVNGAPTPDGGSAWVHTERHTIPTEELFQAFTLPAEVRSSNLKGFGFAVDNEEVYVAVGAPFDDADAADGGAVALLRCDGFQYGGQCNMESVDGGILRPPANSSAGGLYGFAVKYLAFRCLIVAAPGFGEGGPGFGRVYVYTMTNTGGFFTADFWDQESVAVLQGDGDVMGGDRFGFAIDAFDDTLVVADPAGLAREGAAGSIYVFKWDEAGKTFTQSARLEACDGSPYFGFDVSLIQGKVVALELRDPDVEGIEQDPWALRDALRSASAVVHRFLEGEDGVFRAEDDQPPTEVALGRAGPLSLTDGALFLGAPGAGTTGPSEEVAGVVFALDEISTAEAGQERFQDGYTQLVETQVLELTDDAVLWDDNYLMMSKVAVTPDSNTVFTSTFVTNFDQHKVGEVQVFSRSSSGDTFERTQIFSASDAMISDYFGAGLRALSNSLLIVGNSPSNSSVFQKMYAIELNEVTMQWEETEILYTSPACPTRRDTARHLDAYGNCIITNCPSFKHAYIYCKNLDGGWTQVDWVTDSASFFGVEDVAMSSEFFFVGATDDTELFGPGGSVLYWSHNADAYPGEAWTSTYQGKLLPPDRFGWYFGGTLTADGNRIMVGRHGHHTRGIYSGSVYIFERVGSGWELVQHLGPDQEDSRAEYGREIVLDGNLLLVSAPINALEHGTLFVYQRSAIDQPWTEVQRVRSGDLEAHLFGGYRGSGLAKGGATVAVSSSLWPNAVESEPHKPAKVFVYEAQVIEPSPAPSVGPSLGPTYMPSFTPTATPAMQPSQQPSKGFRTDPPTQCDICDPLDISLASAQAVFAVGEKITVEWADSRCLSDGDHITEAIVEICPDVPEPDCLDADDGLDAPERIFLTSQDSMVITMTKLPPSYDASTRYLVVMTETGGTRPRGECDGNSRRSSSNAFAVSEGTDSGGSREAFLGLSYPEWGVVGSIATVAGVLVALLTAYHKGCFESCCKGGAAKQGEGAGGAKPPAAGSADKQEVARSRAKQQQSRISATGSVEESKADDEEFKTME